MKKLFLTLALLISVASSAQVYTNEYPKELTRLAQKWVKNHVPLQLACGQGEDKGRQPMLARAGH